MSLHELKDLLLLSHQTLDNRLVSWMEPEANIANEGLDRS